MTWRRGIQRRITGITLAILIVAFGLSGYFLLRSEYQTISEETRKRGEAIARTLARTSVEMLVDIDYPGLESNVEFTGRADPEILYIKVTQNGHEVASFRAKAPLRIMEGEGILKVVYPVVFETKEIARIELGFDLRPAEERIFARSGYLALGILATLVILSVVISLALRRVVVHPLRGLCDFAEAIERGDFAARVAHLPDDETGLLGSKLNVMAQSLKARLREVAHARRLVERRNRQLARKIAELKRAHKVKSEFLAAMSHELRTPLNGILGFIDLICGGFAGSEEEVKEYLGNARQSSLHLLSLIDDLLDISRIETGHLTLQVQEVDPAEILKDACTEVGPAVNAKGLMLRMEIDPGIPKVLADPTRLRQVVLNLLVNAVKFTDSGGITVRASELAGQGHVLFEVEDIGAGIPPNERDRVFEKFLQLDTGTTRRHGGTGLGLAISKNIVERQGGRIWIEDTASEKGTLMRFTVPLASSDIPPAPPDPADGDAPLVLLVENDPSCRALARTVLRHAGFRVAEARDADSAVSAARKLFPDVVFLDVGLPSKKDALYRDGLDAYAALQRDPGTSQIPVVLITAHDVETVLSRTVPRRGSAIPSVLRKPVDPSTLVITAREITSPNWKPARRESPPRPPMGEPGVA